MENIRVAENTYRLRLSAPNVVAALRPGQFVMLRLAGGDDPLLARPFCVYRTFDDGSLDLVYLVVGKMTSLLARLPVGTALTVWGPLGNGWDSVKTDELSRHILLVAGGVGHTPFYLFAKQQLQNVHNRLTLLYGAKSKSRISCLEHFKALGVDVRVATEDGSEETPGRVTELIEPTVTEGVAAGCRSTRLLACGPHPMLHAVFREAERLGLPCDVSLETSMSCGLGICFGCVIDYRLEPDGEEWDYRRTCVDGPVFDAYRLHW